jgi:hypothetical protein
MSKNSACLETYADVERMLQKIVHGFLAKHGGGEADGLCSFDDAMSVAKLAFLEAREGFDPARGVKFTSHLWNRVFQALADAKRKAMLKRNSPPGNGVARFSEMEQDDQEPDFSQQEPYLDRILRHASDDAATIIKLLVETPAEISDGWFCCEHRIARKQRPSLRKSVQKQTRGWPTSRFWRAWWEAAELVTG